MKCPVCYKEMERVSYIRDASRENCKTHGNFNYNWVKGFWAGWAAHKSDTSQPMSSPDRNSQCTCASEKFFMLTIGCPFHGTKRFGE